MNTYVPTASADISQDILGERILGSSMMGMSVVCGKSQKTYEESSRTLAK
jgi:hypothetical protein